MNRRQIASLWLCVALAGCAGAPAPDLVMACPAKPKEYTAAQQSQAAAELRSLPDDAVLALMMTDYAAQRAAARACRNPQPTQEPK